MMSFDLDANIGILPEERQARLKGHLRNLEKNVLSKTKLTEAQKQEFRDVIAEHDFCNEARNFYHLKSHECYAEAKRYKELYEQPGISEKQYKEYLAKFQQAKKKMDDYAAKNKYYADRVAALTPARTRVMQMADDDLRRQYEERTKGSKNPANPFNKGKK